MAMNTELDHIPPTKFYKDLYGEEKLELDGNIATERIYTNNYQTAFIRYKSGFNELLLLHKSIGNIDKKQYERLKCWLDAICEDKLMDICCRNIMSFCEENGLKSSKQHKRGKS